MTDHGDRHEHAQPRVMERMCDVAVIGGSAAGLAAALQLGRQQRSVIVVDAGDPRNAPAAHMHSYLGHEGVPPTELLAIGRAEVRSYGVEVVPGLVQRVVRADDSHLRVELTGGHVILARRVLAATGITDVLPDIDGLAAQWGRGVIHCPFCHGYEVRDQRIVQIASHSAVVHSAPLFRRLTDRLTLVAAADAEFDLSPLRVDGIDLVSGQVSRVVSDDAGRLTAVQLTDGRLIDADAVAITAPFRARIEPFAELGLRTARHPSGLGDMVEVDVTGRTAIPGLYAAGNVCDPTAQVLGAAAAGSRTGGAIAGDLATEDLRAGRASANEADWDNRYSGEPLWSGNPNGSLVAEVESLEPGRALDVGAGEGGDALWLAERGWQVTASDVSARVLARLAGHADERGLQVDTLHADANASDAYAVGAFDLVIAAYASIPRTVDDRAVHSMVDAVAPGGTLLIISHDLEPMRVPVDTRQESRPFDGDAFVRVEDFARAIDGAADWDVEVNQKRPRPPGAASASHHVDDVVLRARRRSD